MRPFVVFALLAVTAGSACRRAPVTYQRDVAPMLLYRCAGCHTGAAAVPPALGSFEDAARVAALISLVVQRREMPPFGADATGLCGSWQDTPWLSAREIETVAAWAANGAPRGEAVAEPTTPSRSLAPERIEIAPETAFTPSLGSDAYRCFVVDPRLEKDLLVTGVEMRSDPPGAIRQAALYSYDGERVAPWPCYGQVTIAGAHPLASWSWNTPVQRFPEGTGLTLSAGSRVIVQVHYNLLATGLSSPIRVRASLQTGAPEHEAAFLRIAADGFKLPPGRRQVEIGAELPITRPLLLWGVVPRMHTLGRVLRLTRGDGCIAYFGHWNVHDAQLFRTQQPLSLAPGDRLSLVCSYDTTSRDDAVAAGGSIEEEECSALLYTVSAGR